MRVTTNLIFDQNLRAINTSQGELSDLQSQLASGKRLLRPSDDPVGASQVIRLTEDLEKTNQYERNIDMAKSNLELQETSLRSITDVINRARVLTVQSGNGIFSQPDREAVAAEIDQIRNQVIDLMNTQNASGDYIFSGYQSQKQAFAFNPANKAEPIKFQGDDGTNRIQISDSVSIQTTSSGKSVFENVNGRLNFDLVTNNGASLGAYGIRNQGSFDSFHERNYDPVNAVNNQYSFTITAANLVTISNVGTGNVEATLPYDPAEQMNFNGFEFELNGNVGDSLTVELKRPEKTNLAESLHKMSAALNDPNISSQAFSSVIDDTLVGIDNGLAQIARENSSIGARLNIAESIRNSLLDSEVTNQEARSAIQDVDYAQASSDFARQETALEAAFASFPRIANLSLFNYI
ncbi:flagellar hook-associated protein FlgL [Glaciecola siphonariae]|uniref:Flagellar hook-associated protein FlgL n=1 Tax=Glaciecola siphonariae TaxID=521012 RepID=A0ABV9LUJ0_9ALTE